MNGKITASEKSEALDALENLARDVVDLLKNNGLRVSFAESCTGGTVSAAVTSVDGASSVLDMSVVTYANWVKTEYTDVTDEVLNSDGAVSEQTALMMASGIRKRSGADIGVGVTGIAGPGGGTPEKPVGTVYIAIDRGNTHTVRHFAFTGNRREVRLQTTEQALDLLYKSVSAQSV